MFLPLSLTFPISRVCVYVCYCEALCVNAFFLTLHVSYHLSFNLGNVEGNDVFAVVIVVVVVKRPHKVYHS